MVRERKSWRDMLQTLQSMDLKASVAVQAAITYSIQQTTHPIQDDRVEQRMNNAMQGRPLQLHEILLM